MRIQKLSSQVSDKIAAGEVIERPASVVKELIENSIDAGADKINVEIKAAGKELIRISDNGCGIDKADARLAFERHATGKIREIDDIYRISTMGFRGEALSSIAAVSRIELISRSSQDEFAYSVNLENGMMSTFKPTGANRGTSISVKDLFYNTPARFAFLKSERFENNAIREIVDKLAIANPQISFSLSVDNRLIYRTDGRGVLLNTLHRIYGDEFIKGLVEVEFSDLDVKMNGYLSSLDFVKGTKKWQMIFINRRYVSDNLVEHKINEYFSRILGVGKFPVFAINVELPSNKVDVNIHPTKREVLFKDSDRMEMLTFKMLDEVFEKVDMSLKLRVSEGSDCVEKQKNSQTPEGLYGECEREEEKVFEEVLKYKGSIKKDDVIGSLYKSFYKKGQSQYVISDKGDWKEGDSMSLRKEESLPDAVQEEIAAPVDASKNSEIEKLEGFDASSFFEQMKSAQQQKMELELELLAHSSVYEDMNVVAQVFDSYILASSGEDLFFINQHYAHERILYETMIHSIKAGKLSSQILMMMEKLPSDLELFDEEILFFRRFSIIVQSYPNGMYLKELPVIANKVLDVKSAITFMEAMHSYFRAHPDSLLKEASLSESEKYYEELVYGEFEDVVRKEIAKMVCNIAIKENEVLNLFDMKRILEGLKTVKLPYTSIHGKAMLTKLSKSEIFK